ncbi:MAG TPA: PHP domain-containing protein [Sphaerochaeta sp.]|jgi:PHP family Zn ribbon phosphoesterase|nr:PHP domain-containing protein [Sphaerochaeta sp.]HQB54549.1 PHP domain-containing protein [Sphaerochaeta sp.]
MGVYRVDLHNHSSLSPCAEDDLSPFLLAIEAKEKGIDILGLSDHNSTDNLKAFAEACRIVDIVPFFGIEVTTIEEVHVLVLFDRLAPALAFGSWVNAHLPYYPNNEKLFGRQLIYDEEGDQTAEVKQMLATATTLSFEGVVDKALGEGALVIPAHIDRGSQSVLSNLGFLPELPYSAIEVVKPSSEFEQLGYPVLTGSDAHRFEEVGIRSCLIELPDCSAEALIAALNG